MRFIIRKMRTLQLLVVLLIIQLYYVRFIDANTIELYDTWINATTTTSTTGRKDITAVSPDTALHLFTTGKCYARR